MSEPESLAVHEPLAAHLRRHAYDRLLMLSDGIFAIAITLAALEIHFPQRLGSPEALAHAMARPMIVFLLSFVVTAVYWISHRNLFARLRTVDAPLTAVTLAMLCAITLLPVALHGLAVEGQGDAAIRFYAAIMLACGAANSAMWFYAAFRPGLMFEEVQVQERRMRAGFTLGIPLMFGIMLVSPADNLPSTMLPAAVILLLLRRVVAPRYLRRIGGAAG